MLSVREVWLPLGLFVLLLICILKISDAAKTSGAAQQAVRDYAKQVSVLQTEVEGLKRQNLTEMAELRQQDRVHDNAVQMWQEMSFTHIVKLDARLDPNGKPLPPPPKMRGE